MARIIDRKKKSFCDFLLPFLANWSLAFDNYLRAVSGRDFWSSIRNGLERSARASSHKGFSINLIDICEGKTYRSCEHRLFAGLFSRFTFSAYASENLNVLLVKGHYEYQISLSCIIACLVFLAIWLVFGFIFYFVYIISVYCHGPNCVLFSRFFFLMTQDEWFFSWYHRLDILCLSLFCSPLRNELRLNYLS